MQLQGKGSTVALQYNQMCWAIKVGKREKWMDVFLLKVSDKPHSRIQEDWISLIGLWKSVTKHTAADWITVYTSNIPRAPDGPTHNTDQSLTKGCYSFETVGARRPVLVMWRGVYKEKVQHAMSKWRHELLTADLALDNPGFLYPWSTDEAEATKTFCSDLSP